LRAPPIAKISRRISWGLNRPTADEQNDAEQTRRRKVLEHARLNEIRDVEVGERDGLSRATKSATF
jgi:hypothetical protein